MTTDSLDRTPFPRLVRLAAAGRLPPSLLFVGPPGAPMLPAALRLAAVVNSPDRDPESEATRELAERIRVTEELRQNPPGKDDAGWPGPGAGPYPDLRVIHPDGAGRIRHIRVDQIREAIAGTRLRPFEGRRRFLVLMGADTMNPPAANALLKTLEEPNDWLSLILCARQTAALLPTIVSRCQRWRFPSLTPAEVAARLREEHDFPGDLAEIAAATGADPEAAAELQREQLGTLREEAEGLAAVVGRGVPPARRAALTDRLAKSEPELLLALLRATLRDLAAIASDAPPLSFPERKELGKLAALAPPGAWAEASLHAREAHDRMTRFHGNRRMQLEWLLLQFNEIARPLVIARMRRRRAG